MVPLRIAVVDDSALFRTLLRNVLTEIPDCQVVASLSNGQSAVEQIATLRPDVVTLDVEMPGMSGIDVLKELKRRQISTNVIMVSRLTAAGTQVTTDALLEGAFDFILKPSGKSPAENKATLKASLEDKLAMLRLPEELHETAADNRSAPFEQTSRSTPVHPVRAVVIGCSTGGPDSLAKVIPDLPGDLPVPIFIVQHMPEGFTSSLAARLNEASELEVIEAADGQRARPGQVVLARGGSHLQLERTFGGQITIRLTNDPREHSCRPAVDYTLRSAIEAYHGELLGVILTGMGRDGTAGCRQLREQGGQVIAQHPRGCTVYGMPKAVIEAGLADEVVKLSEIASAIRRRTQLQRGPS